MCPKRGALETLLNLLQELRGRRHRICLLASPNSEGTHMGVYYISPLQPTYRFVGERERGNDGAARVINYKRKRAVIRTQL